MLNMRSKLICLLLITVVALGLAPRLRAQDAYQLEHIQQRLMQLQAEVRVLSQDRESRPADSVQQTSAEATNVCADEQVCLGTDSALRSYQPTIKVAGFFQADAGWFHQDSANQDAVGDIQDGAAFRRARLLAKGDAWDNVGYILEMDFAFPGRPNFMDVWLEIRDLPLLGNLRLGQFRHPIGMDGLTSVTQLTFLERALPFAFLPFRQIGLTAHDHAADESMTWAISAFRFPTDPFGGNIGDNGGYAMATRVTWLPIDYGDDGAGVLHLGAAYSFGDPANNRVRYRTQPEFFISETGGVDLVPIGVPSEVPLFVDTGGIAANNFNLFGLEAGTAVGSWHLQSELLTMVVNQIGGPTLAFTGMYIQAGYFLTGESRPYKRQGGLFGRPDPQQPFSSAGGCGAWELAARWSHIDLNDENIRGGRLSNLTFGVNWYLNRFTKFQLNYIDAFLNTQSEGDSNAGIVAARAEVVF